MELHPIAGVFLCHSVPVSHRSALNMPIYRTHFLFQPDWELIKSVSWAAAVRTPFFRIRSHMLMVLLFPAANNVNYGHGC